MLRIPAAVVLLFRLSAKKEQITRSTVIKQLSVWCFSTQLDDLMELCLPEAYFFTGKNEIYTGLPYFSP